MTWDLNSFRGFKTKGKKSTTNLKHLLFNLFNLWTPLRLANGVPAATRLQILQFLKEILTDALVRSNQFYQVRYTISIMSLCRLTDVHKAIPPHRWNAHSLLAAASKRSVAYPKHEWHHEQQFHLLIHHLLSERNIWSAEQPESTTK